MKKFIGITLILIITYVISTFVIGSKAETHVRSLLDKINQNPTISITMSDFEKGLFSSTAKFEFKLEMPMSPDINDLPTLTFTETMYHGPILWRTSGFGLGLMDTSAKLVLSDEIKEAIAKVKSINKDTLSMTSRTTFDGSTTSYIDIAEITIDDDNVTINIHPTEADFYYSLDGHITGNFNWQGLDVVEQGSNAVSMGNVNITLDQRLIRGDLFSANSIFSGSFESTVEKIIVTPKAAPTSVDLSNFIMKGDTTVRDNLMDVDMIFSIDSIKAMNMEFTQFINDISLLSLNIDALEQMNENIMKAQQNTDIPPELAGLALLDSMSTSLPLFIETDPILKINKLGVTTDEGEISTQMEISIDKDLYKADDPNTLMMAVEVHASGEGPEAFFTKLGLAGPIDMYVQQNMLIKEDGLVKFTFDFVKGETLVNGAPLALEAMPQQ